MIIIDEAHNLMDAVAGIHSVEVSLKQLKRARSQIGVYLQKFRNRLKGKNRVYVAQVVRIIDSLSGYLEENLAIPVSSLDTGWNILTTSLRAEEMALQLKKKSFPAKELIK